MKEGQRLWTRDELILAINLYYKIPFGQMHSGNLEVQRLASLINRTPGSVAYKLVNFASLDPSLLARGIKGASNASNLDKAIWLEFYDNLEDIAFESEKLLASIEKIPVEKLNNISESDLFQEGRTRQAIVKLRVNQAFFRKSVMAAYNNTCCITGIKIPSLLVSGHIIPWSIDEKNRLNPRNGIAINALHDKAFENGLITITTDYKIKISSRLKVKKDEDTYTNYFLKYDGKEIFLPSKFLPDPEFLKIHNSRFKV